MNLLASIEERLAPHGILLRGAVSFDEGEGPPVGDGFARIVVLLGNVGGSVWQPFSAWRKSQPDGGGVHPLDNWSRAVIQPIADAFSAAAYYPSDTPWWPFQQWAVKAEGLQASPLGLLIHPEYGLWHGYRGALGFAEPLRVSAAHVRDFPCEGCLEKPCLNSCPVDAVDPASFDVKACRSYLSSAAGQSGCMIKGCLARNACPVGEAYRYPTEQIVFHMRALDI
ncbi:ferredoxin [Rhizobium sp. L1K21]|uniref:ferredoxin n=1 Tax=Rhizobium sp. L1K21 TaxID=2954933 RepID=UPI0020936ED4|nr:ferredoxin [Rhizobium sp. L1K21]MCO6185781.1 ferredoxin [Rhizobium sp. L1K21]